MTPTNPTTAAPPLPHAHTHTQLQRKTSLSGLSQYVNPNVAEKARMVATAHENSVLCGLGVRGDTYKTVMCQTWLETANCGFGANCKFAHGEAELRVTGHPLPINRKYKTRLCEKYTVRGICPYGARCLFIHPDPAEQVPRQQPVSQFVNPWVLSGALVPRQQPAPQCANPWMLSGANRPLPSFYPQPQPQPQERAGPLFVNPYVPFRGQPPQSGAPPSYFQQPFADPFFLAATVASQQQQPGPTLGLYQQFAEQCGVSAAAESTSDGSGDKEQPKPKPSRRPSQNLLPDVLEELRTERRVEKREKREQHKRKIFQMLEREGHPSTATAAQPKRGVAAPQDTSIDDGQKETLASTLASVLDFSAGSGPLNSSR